MDESPTTVQVITPSYESVIAEPEGVVIEQDLELPEPDDADDAPLRTRALKGKRASTASSGGSDRGTQDLEDLDLPPELDSLDSDSKVKKLACLLYC